MSSADKPEPNILLAGMAEDGWSSEEEATATCYCGAVQLVFVSLSSVNLSTSTDSFVTEH